MTHFTHFQGFKGRKSAKKKQMTGSVLLRKSAVGTFLSENTSFITVFFEVWGINAKACKKIKAPASLATGSI